MVNARKEGKLKNQGRKGISYLMTKEGSNYRFYTISELTI